MQILTRVGRAGAGVGFVVALLLSTAAQAGPGDRITRIPFPV
jgi:hypothetical protein